MITIALVLIASVAKAVMDTLQFHFHRSVFSKLNDRFWWPEKAWFNKWKFVDGKMEEKFLGSSTIFVWTTCAWHLFQLVMLFSFFASIVFYKPVFFSGIYGKIADFVLLRVLFGLAFELFYTHIFINEKYNR